MTVGWCQSNIVSDDVVASLRVVVADDDVLLREGLASLLDRAGFDVVGQAGDGAQLLTLVRDKQPDLVVADIRMPPTHTTEGLDAARVIRDEFPDTGDPGAVGACRRRARDGATGQRPGIGYLLKSRVTDVTDFIDTLRADRQGRLR